MPGAVSSTLMQPATAVIRQHEVGHVLGLNHSGVWDRAVNGRQEVQRALGVMQPKQAKDMLLRMVNDADPAQREAVMRDVVTIIKSMPTDKFKKLTAEFKTEEPYLVYGRHSGL